MSASFGFTFCPNCKKPVDFSIGVEIGRSRIGAPTPRACTYCGAQYEGGCKEWRDMSALEKALEIFRFACIDVVVALVAGFVVMLAVAIALDVSTNAMCVAFLCAAALMLASCVLLNVSKVGRSNRSRAEAAVRAAYSKEQVARLIEKMKEMTAVPAVRITAAGSVERLPMSASKFGGLPYWEEGEDYLRAEDGSPLYLLAQINFAEVPPLPDYPRAGLLQIFIAADSDFGASEEQENWRAIWRERFDESRALDAAALRALGAQPAQEAADAHGHPLRFPLKKEYSLSFTKVRSHVNPTNYAIDDAFPAAARALGLPELKDADLNDVLDEDDYRLLYGDLSLTHQIGGYPYSTQEEAMRDCDLLLFQMASDDGIDWLDGGLAHFYISRADLQARDFSRVLYSWDSYGLYGE